MSAFEFELPLKGTAELPPCDDETARAAVTALETRVKALEDTTGDDIDDEARALAQQALDLARSVQTVQSEAALELDALHANIIANDATDDQASAQIAAMLTRLSAVEARPVGGGTTYQVNERPEIIRVNGFDTAAMKYARDALIASKGSGTGAAMKQLYLPPGVYNITENDAMMTPSTGSNDGFVGLEIAGAGRGATLVNFTPSSTRPVGSAETSVGNLFSANKRTRFMHFRDMTIQSMNPLARLFWFYQDGGGNNMNQGCTFERLHLMGNMKGAFLFDGGSTANLNSEMLFVSISGATAAYGEAMFRTGGGVGTYNQQNQFLNYKWLHSFFILNGGVLFDIVKGGNISFDLGSWSAASSTAPDMTFLRLGSNINNTSAAKVRLENVRAEPKAANHVVLEDRLGHGTVTFDNYSDIGSIQNDAGMDYALRRHYAQTPWGAGMPVIPVVTYRNCSLAGKDTYEGPPAQRGRLIYEGSTFHRGPNADMANPTAAQGARPVVTWDAVAPNGAPRLDFEDNWNTIDYRLG